MISEPVLKDLEGAKKTHKIAGVALETRQGVILGATFVVYSLICYYLAGYSHELLKGALVYAGRGIPVFPCEPGGKRPLPADGFPEATTDEARIRWWWGRWPQANVAIPTGERSGLRRPRRGRRRRHGLYSPARAFPRPVPEDGVVADRWGRATPLLPLPFTAGVTGSGPLHARDQEQPGASRGRPGRARRGRLRRRSAEQYVACLPMGGPLAPGRSLVAARTSEGGNLRRDAVLMPRTRLR